MGKVLSFRGSFLRERCSKESLDEDRLMSESIPNVPKLISYSGLEKSGG